MKGGLYMTDRKATAEEIVMMGVRFCEEKGLLNTQYSLPTIEYLRHRRYGAIYKLKNLIESYGTTEDKQHLKDLEKNL